MRPPYFKLADLLRTTMAVMRFVMLPKSLVVLVSLCTSGFSLAICNSSCCTCSIGGRLGALRCIYTCISCCLRFIRCSIALSG